MIENNSIKNDVSLCPHCHEKINVNDDYCKNCGFVLNSNQDVNQEKTFLRFGNDYTTTIEIKKDELDQQYSQKADYKNYFIKMFFSIFFLLFGLFSACIIFMPLFSKDNIWNFLNEISGTSAINGYKYNFPEIFKIDQNSTLFTLIDSIKTFSTINKPVINPAHVFFLYDVVVCSLTIFISVVGLCLVVASIISLIRKKHSVYLKRIIRLITSVSAIMICVLNCYSWALILLVFCGICSHILLYICEVLIKEKPFVKKQLILKSACCASLILLVTLFSFSLIRLNVTNGACLYNFKTANSIEQNYVSCKGIYLEFMQFLQCSSGDDRFTNLTFLISIFALVSHVVYACFAITACVSLFESFSKQTTGFPISKLVVSFVAFIVFSISIILFNKLINDASYSQYMNAVGSNIENALTTERINEIKEALKIFTIRFGLAISMVLYLPIMIYAGIARKLCLKKTFY